MTRVGLVITFGLRIAAGLLLTALIGVGVGIGISTITALANTLALGSTTSILTLISPSASTTCLPLPRRARRGP